MIKKFKITFISIALLIIIGSASLSTFFIVKKSKITPLDYYKSSINFNLYYPKQLPKDVKYKKDSVAKKDNVIFFSLITPSGEIIISQQPSLDDNKSIRIDGFNAIATPIGEMISGNTNSQPVGIINTPDTMIIVKGNSDQNADTINQIAQKLEKL